MLDGGMINAQIEEAAAEMQCNRIIGVILCAGAAIFCVPPADAKEPPWAGVWAADPAWCKFKGSIGEQERGPIQLTGKTFTGFKISCWITGSKTGGFPRTWIIDKACDAKGGTNYQQALLIQSKDGNRLHVADGEGAVTAFQRCE
jgi:hypothetical protein